MCMLHLGLKEELDTYYPEEERDRSPTPRTMMMSRALSMLIYDEYVPMPLCRAPSLCPEWGQITVNLKSAAEVAPRALIGSKLSNSNTMAEVEEEQKDGVFNMTNILTAIAHTAMEDHMVEDRELTGWDVSMSPLLNTNQPAPSRQNLFLGEASRQTLFLGPERASDSVKFVRSGIAEPRFPPASVFIRSASPVQEANSEASWSSLQQQQPQDMDVDETEWVIA